MSRLGRISKLFAAQNASQVISLLTQLLLPPIFLHNYGVTLYGEWLALSAAIGYLATVNYGIQTYTNMQMTIHYNRGEVDECVHLQSGGLFILLIVFLSLAVLLCGIFFIPLDTWLHLQLPLREAQIILYLLSLQIGVGMVFGFFSGNYMVIGSAHRGANFNNLNLLVSTLVMALLAAMRMKLIWLAAAQLAVTVLMTVLFVCGLFPSGTGAAADVAPLAEDVPAQHSEAERSLCAAVLLEHSRISAARDRDPACSGTGGGGDLFGDTHDLFDGPPAAVPGDEFDRPGGDDYLWRTQLEEAPSAL